MRAKVVLFVLLLSVGFSVFIGGCRPQDEAETGGLNASAPLASYQEDLLDVAFAAASAMPLYPHIKNRSRAQEIVVGACLELDQPERARRYIEQIDNWRRGAGYADLALYYARQGTTDQVESCLKLAAQVSAEAEGWRRDRIKAKIAAAYAYLGQAQAAGEQGVATAEWGPVAWAEAMVCPSEAFDEKMATLEKLVSAENFDVVKGALGAYAELYKRFYTHPGRRMRIEERIKASWGSMPVFVRIELLMELSDASLAHADRAKALELVNEAKTMMESTRWQPRFAIPLTARLAELRFRAGDEVGARDAAQEALNLFDAKRETVVNIYRAQILRPITEAFHVMGNTAVALDLYKRAVEAGMENLNSRPRADDLVATCCSMAVHAVEPDAALTGRIREIREGLGDPW